MEKEAKITCKGQITIPLAIRQALGVQTGDTLIFESFKDSIRVRSRKAQSPFAKYRGIGNKGIRSGKKAINRWAKKTRGR